MLPCMDMKIKYVHSSPAVFKFMEKGKLHHGIQEYHIAESHHRDIVSFCCHASWLVVGP